MTYTVLHVVDRTSGGVPRAVHSYIDSTPSVDHVILSPFEDGSPSPVWTDVPSRKLDLTNGAISRVRTISRVHAQVRPDAVHAHSSFSGLFTRIALSPKRARIVYSPHCFKFDDSDSPRALRLLTRAAERALARRTSVFATLSDHESRLASAFGSDAAVSCIPNIPSLPHVSEAPRTNRPDPASPSAGMVGRIASQKDPEFFAEIKREFDDDDSAVTWTWIGDGDPSPLRSRLTSSGIGITGWKSGTELVEVFDGLGVYVHSARYEGFPLSVLDAASRRLPIIARRIPALEETPIMLFDTPREGADLVRRALTDTGFRDSLITRGEELLSTMNRSEQRDALLAVWGAPAPDTDSATDQQAEDSGTPERETP